jgi:hypothetical protein
MDALVPRWPEANERPFAVGRFSGASSYSSFTDFRFKDLANAQSAPRAGSRPKRRRNGKSGAYACTIRVWPKNLWRPLRLCVERFFLTARDLHSLRASVNFVSLPTHNITLFNTSFRVKTHFGAK